MKVQKFRYQTYESAEVPISDLSYKSLQNFGYQFYKCCHLLKLNESAAYRAYKNPVIFISPRYNKPPRLLDILIQRKNQQQMTNTKQREFFPQTNTFFRKNSLPEESYQFKQRIQN
jgi:hypothetical protein